MKKIIILILIICCQQGFVLAEQSVIAPKVDKRVELLSIVFRLAGNREYNSACFKEYNNKLAAHFNQYKNHELIDFANELRVKNGISYDAVVSMAVALDDNLNPVTDFSNAVPEKRWCATDADKFVRLLKKFNKDAKCDEFFEDNEDLFHEVEKRFAAVCEKVDLAWYHSFFGTSADESFTLLISPGCGNQNYGPSFTLSNNKKNAFAIMGIWRVDESGMPVFKEGEYLPYIIHEFAHSFVNPLLEKYSADFKESGVVIYEAVEYEMSRQQAYGNWQIMLNEALVRASVIKYFIDHGVGETKTQQMLNQESNRGFIWIKGLVADLRKYGSQREQYLTLESYIPNLALSYKTFAQKISQYDSQKPKVESISEFKNNDTNVDSQISTITINFNSRLLGKGYSVNFGRKGKRAFPKLNKIFYTNDNKSVVMEVQLIADKEYQFVLTGKNFKTEQGIPLKTYEVNFKTQ